MKYIEIAVADSFDDDTMTTYDALDHHEDIGPARPVGQTELIAVLRGLRDDVESAYGAGDELDEDALDWPDLADTYRRACQLLDRLDRETRP